MFVEHSGISYECASAIKCENDKYIKLYNENGAEIAAFNHISDFSEYTASGGSFVDPSNCTTPIALTPYATGGRTISANDWILTDSGDAYYCTIENELISANVATCNVLLLFAAGTELEYTAQQEAGKITLSTTAAPLADVVIESVQITRT